MAEQIVLTIGAIGLGFVLGWTLFFANRGKAGNISVTDLVAIAGVIAGGAIATLIDKVGGADGKALMFGGYGIGLFIGFLTQYVLVRLAKPGSRAELAASSLMELGLRTHPLVPGTPGVLAAPLTSPGATPSNADLKTDLQAARDAIAEVTRELAAATDAAEDAGQTAKADAIREDIRRLDETDQSLAARLASTHLNGSEMTAFLGAIQTETARLHGGADRMRQVTNAMAKVAKLLSAFDALLGTLRRLA